MNAETTIQNSIFWQYHVLTNAQNEKQKERARNAIQKLEIELSQVTRKNRQRETGFFIR